MRQSILLSIALIYLANISIYALPEGQIQPSASSYQISGTIGYAFYDSENVQAQFQRRTVCTASVPCTDYDQLFPHNPYYQLDALYRWKTSGVGIKFFYNGASERIEGIKVFEQNHLFYKANQSISCTQLGLFFDSHLLDLKPDYRCNFIIGLGYQRFSSELNERYSSNYAVVQSTSEKSVFHTGYIEPGVRLAYEWNSISLGINLSYNYCLDDYVAMTWNGLRFGAIAGVSI